MSKWPLVAIDDLVEDIIDRRGVTPTKLGSNFSAAGHRVISAKLVKGGAIDLTADEPRYVDGRTYARWMRRPLRADDVILTSEAPLGEVAYLGSDVDWVLGQRLFALRSDKRRLHGRYLYYALQADPSRSDLEARATGTTAQGVRQTELRRVRIPLPPLTEQRHIADILGALDDKVDLNRRISETLESTMRELFGRWCLAGSAEKPEHWAATRLGNVVELAVDRCAAGPETEGRPYVPIDSLRARSLVIGSHRPGSEARTSLTRFKGGDILFGAMRPYFHKVSLAPFDGTTRTTVFVLRARRKSDVAYALLLLDLDETIDYATRHSTGSTIPYATWQGSLAEMPVSVPPEAVRNRLSQAVDPLVARLQRLHAETAALSDARDILLPRLLSGELPPLETRRPATGA